MVKTIPLSGFTVNMSVNIVTLLITVGFINNLIILIARLYYYYNITITALPCGAILKGVGVALVTKNYRHSLGNSSSSKVDLSVCMSFCVSVCLSVCVSFQLFSLYLDYYESDFNETEWKFWK